MNHIDVTKALKRFHGYHSRVIDLSLDRIFNLLDRLGNPHKKLPPTIHIAGTNGKGSTLASLRAVLEAHGQRVHCYTSPNLIRFNERIRLSGKLISDEELLDLIEFCETANAGGEITFFEMTTALAFTAFARHEADFLLLEVGLGGRCDATNVIDTPLLSVLTSISVDHRDFLGDDIADIAREKAGIIKENSPVIAGKQMYDDVADIFAQTAAEKNAPLLLEGKNWSAQPLDREQILIEGAGFSWHLPPPSLLGFHQIDNVALAVMGLSFLEQRGDLGFQLNQQKIAQGIQQVTWPARLQKMKQEDDNNLVNKLPCAVYVDGGHNEDAGRVVSLQMQAWQATGHRVHLIIGMKKGKDVGSFLKQIIPHAQEIYAVPIDGEISYLPPQEIAVFDDKIQAKNSLEGAVASLRDQVLENDIVLIVGSLYLAGEALRKNGEEII